MPKCKKARVYGLFERSDVRAARRRRTRRRRLFRKRQISSSVCAHIERVERHRHERVIAEQRDEIHDGLVAEARLCTRGARWVAREAEDQAENGGEGLALS